MRGNLVWDICTFVPSKAALTKEVVFHKSGLSKRYYCISDLEGILGPPLWSSCPSFGVSTIRDSTIF